METPYTIAQISDLHLGRSLTYPSGRREASDNLRETAASLTALAPRPDLLMVTGDIVDREDERLYQQARDILENIGIPYRIAAGNHDHRQLLRTVFPERLEPLPEQRGGWIQYTLEYTPLRVIVLDTLVPGKIRGLLDRERLVWLAEKLAIRPEAPTILFFHHPPFDTGMPFMDSIGLEGKNELAEVISGYQNIEAVAAGHVHRAISCRWGGSIAYTAPSTAFGFDLELRPTDGLVPIDAPPAFRLFRWSPSAGLRTHLCFARSYDAESR